MIGAVTVVGLGVDIVVAGPDEAAVLAGIVVGFCEVVGAVLAVSGWAGERRSAEPAETAEPAIRQNSVPESQPIAAGGDDDSGGGKYIVDARGATGVQVGDGNTQHIDARPERS